MDTQAVFTLDEIQELSVSDLLRLVLEKKRRFQIAMPNGERVIVQPEPKLMPLPELEGSVPEGWKDAIYA